MKKNKTREPLTSGPIAGSSSCKSERVTHALILAAGTGSRLRPLTLDAPKCLTEVGGKPILGRQIDSLRTQGIRNLVMVAGFEDGQIRRYLDRHAADMQVDYVFNPLYATTNNIYSLWLAKHLIDGPFMLLESDLVFETSMLDDMLQPDTVAVSNILPWMNGTNVELDANGAVTSFNLSHGSDDVPRYKTVNIYTFSAQNWKATASRLDQYISAGRTNDYYEAVFAEMIPEGTVRFEAVFFDENKWYEIDTVNDLSAADTLFHHVPRFVAKDEHFLRVSTAESMKKRGKDTTVIAKIATASSGVAAAMGHPDG